MSKKQDEHKKPPTIADLYPHLSKEQLQEAEENLKRYIQLALQIYESIREDPVRYAQLKDLTASESYPSMHDTKADPSNNPLPSSQA